MLRVLNFLKRFRRSSDGAVSVDFVVLTAALVGLAAMAATSISQGSGDLSAKVKKCQRITANQYLKRDRTTRNRSKIIKRRCKRL